MLRDFDDEPGDDTTYSAAVLHMDFGGTRVEQTVVCFCRDLSLLVGLLENPIEYMQDLQGLWSFEENPCTNWDLGDPATVFLEWAGRSDMTLRHFFGRSGAVLPKDGTPNGDGKKDEDKGKDKDKSGPAPAATERDKMISVLNAELPNGGFSLEFAIDTRTVTVWYYLPKKHAQMFKVKVTAQTLVMKDKYCGNLHFDIGRSRKDRAHFIMDYINCPGALIKTSIATNPKFRKHDAATIGCGGEIPDVLPNTPLPVGKIPKFKDCNPIDRRIIMEHRSGSGTRMMTPAELTGEARPDDPPPPPVDNRCVCVDVTVSPDGDDYVAGPLVVKFYEQPCS